MATFLILGKYSRKAVEKISPERTDKSMELAKKFNGDIKEMFAMLGEYDLLFVTEFPAMEKAMQFSVALSKLTGLGFTTCPAVTVAEFDKLMGEV